MLGGLAAVRLTGCFKADWMLLSWLDMVTMTCQAG